MTLFWLQLSFGGFCMPELSHLSGPERIEMFIETYEWLRRASGERLLSRANLNFKAVHPFANSMTVVDVSEPHRWKIRLSGTKVCERLGCDRTGRDAQSVFSSEERRLRLRLAHSMFNNPCGIRAKTAETHVTGDRALLDTIALPLIGSEGEKLVVHYAQIIDDIEHDYGARPLVRHSDLISFDYVDLGYGVPRDVPCDGLRIA